MRAGHAAELKKKAGINAPFLDEGAEALGHLRHHPSRYTGPESLVVPDLYEELRCHVLKTVTTLLRACPKVSAGIQNIEPRTQNAECGTQNGEVRAQNSECSEAGTGTRNTEDG